MKRLDSAFLHDFRIFRPLIRDGEEIAGEYEPFILELKVAERINNLKKKEIFYIVLGSLVFLGLCFFSYNFTHVVQWIDITQLSWKITFYCLSFLILASIANIYGIVKKKETEEKNVEEYVSKRVDVIRGALEIKTQYSQMTQEDMLEKTLKIQNYGKRIWEMMQHYGCKSIEEDPDLYKALCFVEGVPKAAVKIQRAFREHQCRRMTSHMLTYRNS